MSVETVLLFALTEFLLSLTPGPAVLLVISLSMRQGFQSGLMASCGVIATNAIFFLLSALGVGAVIIASATLFTILKWVGAAYLIYLGIGMLMPIVKRVRRSAPSSSNGGQLSNAAAFPTTRRISLSGAFWKGATLQASTPKNLAFFVAILPQFISPDGNVPVQVAILGIVSVILELPILVIYSVATALSARVMRERLIEWIEAAGGSVLIGLSGLLATSERGS